MEEQREKQRQRRWIGICLRPIVAMTAKSFAEDVQAAENAGMDGHIAKPVDVAVMKKYQYRSIEQTLNGSGKTRQDTNRREDRDGRYDLSPHDLPGGHCPEFGRRA